MKQKTKNKLAQIFGPILIKFLIGSLRIKRINKQNIFDAKNEFGSVIYAFWHNRLLTLSYAHRFENIRILVSKHQDGEYISRAAAGLGYTSVRGSTKKGGMRAMVELVRASKKYDIGITPDGPRGPKEQIQDGILYLAYKTGKPIIPASCDSKKKWVLNSWDNFIIPKPFSETKIIYGQPILVSNKDEIISKKGLLQKKLINLGKKIEY
ncbi:MAG: lysophospholipid acyltransferase family protein [Candidatus Cloacimonetes bacterium]|nr:lysophospholipid acyltransferase family protein [Candidatus Cloacimonadota bacterium]MBL7108531.1 lysophospholipid acyltransferase family protein [Candidatus Cloacimonadota bacterium]